MYLADSTIFRRAMAQAMNRPTPMGGRKTPMPIEAEIRTQAWPQERQARP